MISPERKAGFYGPDATAARVEARLNELKAENAELRGFVETVASHSAAPGSWMKRLIDEANELLAKIDKRL
jgi:hypothetical protein